MCIKLSNKTGIDLPSLLNKTLPLVLLDNRHEFGCKVDIKFVLGIKRLLEDEREDEVAVVEDDVWCDKDDVSKSNSIT
ncbi:hypothetical protein V6N11_061790 [Hibiscus sabdariffa]|uniref:Uncharacterized protein n=1 Tax=Hibiscus sabdariffa TaxID=183260 RepID=A0ABR1ZVI4_9ROSI